MPYPSASDTGSTYCRPYLQKYKKHRIFCSKSNLFVSDRHKSGRKAAYIFKYGWRYWHHFAFNAKIRMLPLYAKTCRFVSWKTYAKTFKLRGRYSPQGDFACQIWHKRRYNAPFHTPKRASLGHKMRNFTT